jgi:hypothetical protein
MLMRSRSSNALTSYECLEFLVAAFGLVESTAMTPAIFPLILTLAIWAGVVATVAAEVRVHDAAGLRAAVAAATPGTRIELAAGNYGGGFQFAQLRGEAGKPIIIASADPRSPAVLGDAKTGLHLANPAFVELRDLEFAGLSANGLNIDDGGDRDGGGAHHVVLHGLRVHDVGSGGNQDGIKLSGLADFRVEACTIERWGAGGSGIDMVGCHRGQIVGNVLRHTAPPGANGVQCKGGSSAIAIRGNRFEAAGGRGVNIGGSTGRQFFRPPLAGDGPHAEARDIRVEGNTFVGGGAPVAFVGVDGAVVRFNTIEQPGRWAVRILQENKAADFVPSRGGEFSDNVIVFASARWAEGGVNLGAGTAPGTFTFARNWWYCADDPARSRPKLPTPETDGVYGQNPDTAKGRAGADAWRERK